ncbi:hypothetical protein B0H17DRAFT_1157412 [Mycena rosella]|uniref:Uncharacterized protein n=1 Tax=Mycena rosella TaxID=1033263 RepID=A0AAD7DYQ6_MYCRO|nr:hypothetical protein B0H17DRAFT_1157412 [Mycena rosella]
MSWLNYNLVPYIARLRILPDTQVATQHGVQTRDLMSYLFGIKCWVKCHKVTVYALKHDQMKGFDYLSPQGILGHHYLNDLTANDPNTLTITSGQLRNSDPHLSDDHLSTKIVVVEATDDSYIFARTVPALCRNLTQWIKSMAYALGPTLSHSTPSPTNPASTPHHHHPTDFLRTKNIRTFIDEFTFPKFTCHPPITLLRKIVKQNMISRARALLSLQPIKRIDADNLDTLIKTKIHAELGMPYTPSTVVLTLPIELHGLDFPSIEGRNIYILQGELTGLVMGLILADPSSPASNLYTDHLNSARLTDDSKTVVDQQHRLRTMNGRSYYRWILVLAFDNPLYIVYTRVHTDDQSRFLQDVPCTPVPTSFMDDFCFYTTHDGWIESNIRTYVDKSIATSASRQLATGHQLRMALHLYDPKAPPEYSYTHAYSAYSAVVQLYACSGQLPTADILYSRGKLADTRCRMGCAAIEDAHHVFVECVCYDEWRAGASEELHRRDIEEVKHAGLLAAVKSFLSDNDNWPLHYSTYYLGHIPRFDHVMPTPSRAEDSLTHS